MEALKERIQREGQNLGGGILKVDGFINHQVDPALMLQAGRELAARFADVGATKVLGVSVFLMASPEFLSPGERFLIIDDFLASGQTIGALVRMVQHAGAQLVGIGALIEKAFEDGRRKLEPLGIPLHALAVIAEMSDGRIVFAD